MGRRKKWKESDFELPALAIGYLRETKGWSYEEIARRLQCNRATVWRAHTQGTEPMKHTVKALIALAKKVWFGSKKNK